MENLRAAVVQVTATRDLKQNLEQAAQLVRAAFREGAALIVLPENFAWIRVPQAEPVPAGAVEGEAPGPVVAAMQPLAAECGCHLLLGGIPEAGPDSGKVYNSSVLLGPDGEVAAVYRKRHLFDVDLPEGPNIRESDHVEPGDRVVCARIPQAVIGLSICYDLRFPEHYRSLVDAGAEVLTVPAAFTLPTGKAHWHLLVRARAVENQCFAIAPNQTGFHGGDRHSFGHSLIVDPWGVVLADAGEGPGIAVADLDPNRLIQVRTHLPALDHRR